MRRFDCAVSDEIHDLFVQYVKSINRSARAHLAFMIKEELKREGWLDERGNLIREDLSLKKDVAQEENRLAE